MDPENNLEQDAQLDGNSQDGLIQPQENQSLLQTSAQLARCQQEISRLGRQFEQLLSSVNAGQNHRGTSPPQVVQNGARLAAEETMRTQQFGGNVIASSLHDDEEHPIFRSCHERHPELRSSPNPSQIYTRHYNPGTMPSSSLIPINQIEPPTFDGDRARARAWLKKYESIMDINGYDDDQKLKRARAYLTGEAEQWFNTSMRLMQDPNWYSLKASFTRHFCGTDGMVNLRRRLADVRQQRDEHPNSFLVRAVDLCLEYQPRMADHDEF